MQLDILHYLINKKYQTLKIFNLNLMKNFKNSTLKLLKFSKKYSSDYSLSLRNFYKKLLSQFNEFNLHEFNSTYLFGLKKENSKRKRVYFYISQKFIPALYNNTDKVVQYITSEQGDKNWNSINQSRKWNRIIIWSLTSFVGIVTVWAIFSKVDETVQSTGKIEPKETTIDVKVPIGGVIKKILVKEGELVKKEQILLKLDTTAAKSKLEALDRVKSQINADSLLSKIQLGESVNISNLTSNQKIKLSSLKSEYESRINASISAVEQIKFQKDSILEKFKSQKDVLQIREEILLQLKEVTEIGGLSKVKYAKEKQEVIQLRGQVLVSEAELNRVAAQLSEAESRLLNTIAASKIDFTTKIEENNKQVAQLQNQISDAKLTLDYQEIRSPLDGLIFDLQPAAPGFVVNSNSPILKIVPIDDLVARIFISNRDIAFIKKGQIVKIRLDAYPYNEFGELEGEIESIGSDVLEPDEKYQFFRFPVTVKLKKAFLSHQGKELPLITGMSLSANIVLRQRPVISLFTETILPFWNSLEQI